MQPQRAGNSGEWNRRGGRRSCWGWLVGQVQGQRVLEGPWGGGREMGHRWADTPERETGRCCVSQQKKQCFVGHADVLKFHLKSHREGRPTGSVSRV